jgi:hypothetical protein
MGRKEGDKKKIPLKPRPRRGRKGYISALVLSSAQGHRNKTLKERDG